MRKPPLLLKITAEMGETGLFAATSLALLNLCAKIEVCGSACPTPFCYWTPKSCRLNLSQAGSERRERDADMDGAGWNRSGG